MLTSQEIHAIKLEFERRARLLADRLSKIDEGAERRLTRQLDRMERARAPRAPKKARNAPPKTHKATPASPAAGRELTASDAEELLKLGQDKLAKLLGLNLEEKSS